jgi:hypothetical protein
MPKDKDFAEASDAGSEVPIEDAVRERAYQLFEQHGCEHGHDLEDWLQAEAEITWKTRRRAPGPDVTARRPAAA